VWFLYAHKTAPKKCKEDKKTEKEIPDNFDLKVKNIAYRQLAAVCITQKP
jgi:hypothetical protein